VTTEPLHVVTLLITEYWVFAESPQMDLLSVYFRWRKFKVILTSSYHTCRLRLTTVPTEHTTADVDTVADIWSKSASRLMRTQNLGIRTSLIWTK